MKFNIQKIQNKDHDIMIGYLESQPHELYAWNYHVNRAAKYIKKLERIITELKNNHP